MIHPHVFTLSFFHCLVLLVGLVWLVLVWFEGLFFCLLVGWLIGWFAGFLVGWIVPWSVGRSIGWLLKAGSQGLNWRFPSLAVLAAPAKLLSNRVRPRIAGSRLLIMQLQRRQSFGRCPRTPFQTPSWASTYRQWNRVRPSMYRLHVVWFLLAVRPPNPSTERQSSRVLERRVLTGGFLVLAVLAAPAKLLSNRVRPRIAGSRLLIMQLQRRQSFGRCPRTPFQTPSWPCQTPPHKLQPRHKQWIVDGLEHVSLAPGLNSSCCSTTQPIHRKTKL